MKSPSIPIPVPIPTLETTVLLAAAGPALLLVDALLILILADTFAPTPAYAFLTVPIFITDNLMLLGLGVVGLEGGCEDVLDTGRVLDCANETIETAAPLIPFIVNME